MRKIQVLNRLWVRLALAFAVVAVIGIGLAAFLADQSINREFRSFVVRNEVDLQNSSLANDLVEYYQQHQSWDGVGTVLPQGGPQSAPGPQPGGPPPDQFRGRMALMRGRCRWARGL